MNILLTGAAGQLGHELLPLLETYGNVTRVDRQFVNPTASDQVLDLSDLNATEVFLNRYRPDLLVNAAAYTAVDQAEQDSSKAFRINAEMPGCLARWCERNDRLLVHYSTDYVFEGNASHGYVEDDLTGPLNVYGESKLAGEWAIASSRCRHLTLRTSWVYSSHGKNFVLTMLELARSRPELSIVSDQVGCPTWARNLARATSALLKQARDNDQGLGLLHYCDSGVVSWYEFAGCIFELAHELGLLESIPNTQPVTSKDFRQLAERPAYSVLNTSNIQKRFGIESLSLESSLRACLEEISER